MLLGVVPVLRRFLSARVSGGRRLASRARVRSPFGVVRVTPVCVRLCGES